MNYPVELKYTKEHEWVKVEGDVATVGITAFAQDQLGDIVYADIEVEGEEFSKDDEFGSVESVKSVSELYMPISGKVEEVNSALEDTPELINSDPYGAGWMIKISGFSAEEVEGLLSAEQYMEIVSEVS